MAEEKKRLLHLWSCTCWRSPSVQHGSGEQQSEIITKATSTSSKTRKFLLLHRHTASSRPAASITTASPDLNLLNKNLCHFQLGNSSEEGGYIQAISPSPSSTQGSSSAAQPLSFSSSSRTATASTTAAPFFPPAGCALDLEREHKHPKIHLKDSWDGLVMLHSPKTGQEQQENQENGDDNRNYTLINNNTDDTHTDTEARLRASQSPLLLNHDHYRHGPRQQNPNTTAAVGAAGARENEINSQLRGPLATPQSFLEEISSLVAINDQEHVISALILLARGIKHHQHRLDGCLMELLAVATACLQSKDDKVVGAALDAAIELVRMYGDLLLQHMYAQQQEQQQVNEIFLFQLMLCATRFPSSSPSSFSAAAGSIRSTSDALLTRIASKMHQPSIIKLLEPLAGRNGSTSSSSSTASSIPEIVKKKAASTLLIATYRLT